MQNSRAMNNDNNLDIAKKNALNRRSDQYYYLSKALSRRHLTLNPNPEFNEDDAKRKAEILGIPDLKTCFITNKECNGVGDHLYEVNGFYKKTKLRGVYDIWNTLPVCGTENSSYKIVEFTMPDGTKVKKNIGHETLDHSMIEYLSTSNDEKSMTILNKYNKIIAWKDYVKFRGAHISYEESESFKNIRKRFAENYEELWEKTIIDILNNT